MPRRSSRVRSILCRALAVASGVAGLAGVVAATGAAPAGAAVTHDSTVYAFGSAGFHGSTESAVLSRPIVAMSATANGAGYWLVSDDGGVFGYNAPFYGSLHGFPLGFPVVGITATPTGHGYWIVTSDGSVVSYGDAHFYGSLTHVRLNAPIKALIAAPGGKGYWLYAADGGVFGYGSARFHGSTGNIRLAAPVVGMTATASGKGYWLVARDGGIFGFGDALFYGSAARFRLAAPIVGMARDGTGHGYWLAGADGGVFGFGDAKFRGSASGLVDGNHHVVQLTGMPDGNGYRMLALHNAPARRYVRDVGLVGPGASGAGVTYIQQRLLAMGYWLPGANGVYDINTTQAVYAFQKANGLPRTGVVDSATQVRFRTAVRPRARSRAGRVIEIDKPRQILMIAVNGYAVWTFNTSTGSDHPYNLDGVRYSAHTPEGVYKVVRDVNGPAVGPLGVLYRPKFFTWTGIAVHGYSNVPPYPASHGCTRVSNAAIDWIWANNIMPIGQAVWVY